MKEYDSVDDFLNEEMASTGGLREQMQQENNIAYYDQFTKENFEEMFLSLVESVNNAPRKTKYLLAGFMIKYLYPGEFEDLDDDKLYLFNYDELSRES